MIRLQHIIGLPVIILENGKYVGTVKDVWFDEHWHLNGLILDYAKWFAMKVRTVLWNAVLNCGEDAIFIASDSSVSHTRRHIWQRTFCTGDIQLKDLPVITVNGLQLGRVSDVYFYPFEGTQIVGYELSDGFVSDLMVGRKWLKAPIEANSVLLGEDAIIVPAVSESELEPVAASNFRE